MLSKRSIICLLTLIIILLTACIGNPPAPVGPTKKLEDVIEQCTRPNYQVVIDENKHYCFSHPFGYYQDENSSPEKFSIRNNSIPSTIQSDTPPEAISTSTSLLISYEELAGESQTLEDLIESRDLVTGKNSTEFDFVPWVLGEEDAYLRKWVYGTNVSYFIYTEHKNYFYTLEFNSSSSLSDQNTCASTIVNPIVKTTNRQS